MTDRRAILSLGGAIVGILAGAVAAANGAPVAGSIAAIGALIAGLANAMSRPDPRDSSTTAPLDTDTPASSSTATSETTSSDASRSSDQAVPSTSVPASASAAFAPPADGQSAPDGPNLFGPPPDQERVPLLTDPVTGLFSEDYFDIAIEARIAAARRHLRPVGVVLLEVVQGLRLNEPKPTDPLLVAEAVRVTLREADTASRREDGKFALLLEDTPENGAIWTVERIRRHLVEADASLTVWAGVACYPAHAFDKESIMRAAEAALVSAREWHQDRIEVAIGE